MSTERIFSFVGASRDFDRRSLFSAIAAAFPPSDPIHKLNDFQPQTLPYSLGGRREVNIQLTPEEIDCRLNLICDVLTSFSVRNADDSPFFTRDETYDAFSVIATNWLSIHGCLGTDGHGRALVRLFPLTLDAAGYVSDFFIEHFTNTNSKSRDFDIRKTHLSLVLLNGHINAGLRILAAQKELDNYGKISPQLRDRYIISDPQTRKRADNYARRIVADNLRKGDLK